MDAAWRPTADDLAAEPLAALRTPKRRPGRLLLTGWFSFRDGEATAGDVLAQRHLSTALARAGVPHDTAWSPVFRPDALSLTTADPRRYDTLVFACGPVHGPQFELLHRRFGSCRRLAVGVSVVEPADPAVTGFSEVLARDGTPAPARPDLAAAAPLGPLPPVVGVVLSGGRASTAAAAGTRR
ncbi:hypothetical protein [Streptomyces sp. NPDC087787]|uniref:hypothetical protein n=1 Tax=Streptomyces sp. NPDC087787 TaxID=3365803 RepID=UPI00380F1E57